MAGKIRHKTVRKDAEKRAISKITRRSHTWFLVVVAISSVLLFMSSKMLRNRRNSMLFMKQNDLDPRIKKWQILGRSKVNDKVDSSLLNQIEVVPDIKSAYDVIARKQLATLDNTKSTKPIFICQNFPVYLLVLVFSEEQNSHLRDVIRTTWCQRHRYSDNRHMTCLYVIGQKSSEQETFSDELIQESNKHGDVIMTSLRDDVRNSSLKLLTSMKWVTKNCLYTKFVMRTEDDVIINNEKLMNKILPEVPTQKFAGGQCAPQQPVRNEYSKYFVSYEQYSENAYPPVCSSMGYIMSSDVFRHLHDSFSNFTFIPLDHIFVGILLRHNDVKPRNITRLVRGSAFQLNSDSTALLCDYVIFHLHGNGDEEAIKVWRLMRDRCKKS